MSGDKIARGHGHIPGPVGAYQKECQGPHAPFPLFEPGAGDGPLGHAQRDLRRRHHGHTGAHAQVQDVALWGRRADKQVYLITDTEPNCEDGKYIGFEKATLGVLQEAIVYQREGITLNIIMLDNTPHLREFASVLARRNLGRVFFASPKELGRVVMEDYLRTRKRQRLKKAI